MLAVQSECSALPKNSMTSQHILKFAFRVWKWAHSVDWKSTKYKEVIKLLMGHLCASTSIVPLLSASFCTASIRISVLGSGLLANRQQNVHAVNLSCSNVTARTPLDPTEITLEHTKPMQEFPKPSFRVLVIEITSSVAEKEGPVTRLGHNQVMQFCGAGQ